MKAIQSGTFYKKVIEITEKRLILTIAKGEFYETLALLTHGLMKDYAKKCEADFLVLSEGREGFPHYYKCEIGDKYLNDYDRILYIDTDIIIRPDSPNLFEIVPLDSLALFNEGKYTERTVGFKEYLAAKGQNPENWNGKYYNTGVFLCSKMHKDIFKHPVLAEGEKQDQHFFEQSYFNMMISLYSPKMFELPYDFNRMSCMEMFCGKHRLGSYFVHYAGLQFSLGSEKAYFDLIQNDIIEWKKMFTPVNALKAYRHNIVLQCNGGLGDVIDAEPVARYITDVAYKNANVIIVTHTKEVFDHLGVPVIFGHEVIPSHFIPYIKLETLPNITTDFYKHVSPMMIQATDMMALQALKRTLPYAHRRIKLEFDDDHMNELLCKLGSQYDEYITYGAKSLNDAVVMHVGRGWPSKTFPNYVWEDYIENLQNEGITVILIGKKVNDFNKYVDLELRNTSRMIDLRDRLPLKELFALMSITPCLITNDSGPLHVMGAFDGYIGVLATCKNPEYILPYRKNDGDVFWRAENLCEGDIWEDYNGLPSNIDGAQVDECTMSRLSMAAPSREKLINFVKHACNMMKLENGEF